MSGDDSLTVEEKLQGKGIRRSSRITEIEKKKQEKKKPKKKPEKKKENKRVRWKEKEIKKNVIGNAQIGKRRSRRVAGLEPEYTFK